MGCGEFKNKKKNEDGLNVQQSIVEKEANKPLEAKIVLLGDQNVGKSSISQRYCKNIFPGHHAATIGAAYFQQKIVLNNGVTLKLHIWDTGGQERFRSMQSLYYRDASAAIITYDIGSERSFEGINYWVDELRAKSNQDKIILALAGNKCDKESKDRLVPTSAGKGKVKLHIIAFADQNNMIFYETSARVDTGIKELFNTIAKRIYDLCLLMEKR